MRRVALAAAALLPGLAATAPATLPSLGAQEAELGTQEAERISTSWFHEPLENVLLAFATFTGRSIVPDAGIDAVVTAEIVNQPWDVALEAVAASLGLVVEEDGHGILRIRRWEEARARDERAPLITRAYRLSYADAAVVAEILAPLLGPRGMISASLGTSLVVTDLPAVHESVDRLLSEVDVEIPQVSIRAKIVFVNRTKLDELGVSYELAGRAGESEVNGATGHGDDDPGPEPEDDQGSNAAAAEEDLEVSLAGNSIRALGNASVTIATGSLQLLATLVLGRYNLLSFLDALEAASISEIEAVPQVTTLDGFPAEIHVGEVTPIRTIDAGATGSGAFPTAQVSQQETGIILRATPHVTADGSVVLDLEAERSAAEPAASDVGYIFRTQRASTRVLVENGGTVVIAGLTQREQVETLSGIPLLMHIPLLGRLFRVTRSNAVQRDLVILVTPSVVTGSAGPTGAPPRPSPDYRNP